MDCKGAAFAGGSRGAKPPWPVQGRALALLLASVEPGESATSSVAPCHDIPASFYDRESMGARVPPAEGQLTSPDRDWPGRQSWLKAPSWNGATIRSDADDLATTAARAPGTAVTAHSRGCGGRSTARMTTTKSWRSPAATSTVTVFLVELTCCSTSAIDDPVSAAWSQRQIDEARRWTRRRRSGQFPVCRSHFIRSRNWTQSFSATSWTCGKCRDALFLAARVFRACRRRSDPHQRVARLFHRRPRRDKGHDLIARDLRRLGWFPWLRVIAPVS